MKLRKQAKLLLLCLSLSWGVPTYAFEWTAILKDETGTIYYFDVESLARYGDEIVVRQKWDHSKDSTTDQREKILIIRYNCVEKTQTEHHIFVTYPDGSSESYQVPEHRLRKMPVSDNKVGGRLLSVACRLK